MEIEQSPLARISDKDREIAVALLDGLLNLVGDSDRREVRADDLHRIVCLVSAIVLESDQRLTGPVELAHSSTALGTLIDYFANKLREERGRSGIGLMDLVLAPPDISRNSH